MNDIHFKPQCSFLENITHIKEESQEQRTHIY